MHNYRKLNVWSASVELATVTYEATRDFPRSEQFGFTGQLRRSATSIAANLAEGAGRGSNAEFRRFVRIAAGSANEYETHVIIAQQVGLFGPAKAADLLSQIGSIKRMLYALADRLSN